MMRILLPLLLILSPSPSPFYSQESTPNLYSRKYHGALYGRFLDVPPANQSSDSFTHLGELQWGLCVASDVDDNVAYLANGPSLQIYDISNPSQPELLGEIGNVYPKDIYASDSVVFIAGPDLYIVDVRAPNSPVIIGDLPLYGSHRVVVADSFAYVAHWNGLSIVDISDLSNPTVRSSITLGDLPLGLAAKDGYIYVSDGDLPQMYVIDASNPDNLEIVTSINSNTQCAMVQDSLLLTGSGSTLNIYNISNPSNPVDISSVSIGASYYQTFYSIAAEANKVYVGTIDSGIYSIDISNLAVPQVESRITWPYSMAWTIWSGNAGLAISDSYLVASITSGASIIDKSAPDSLIEVSFIPTGGTFYNIEVKDTLAFIAAGVSGLWILNISDPTKPKGVSNIIPGGFTVDLVVADSLVYLVNWAWESNADTNRGLWIINIADRNNPQVLSHHVGITRYAPLVSHNAIRKEGSWIYLLQVREFGNDSTLEVIDVSDPTTPITMGVYQTSAYADNLSIKDSIAYVATNEGLKIIDFHDPYNPSELSSLLSNASSVVVNGTYVYVGRSDSFFVGDISNPGSPILIGSTSMPAGYSLYEGMDLFVLNDYVYWAGGSAVGAMDLSQPETPTLKGVVFTMTNDVISTGEILYFTHGYGLQIVQDDIALPGRNYQLEAGWNLLSVPLQTLQPTPDFLFPSATSSLFAYNGMNYITIDSIEAGVGYWLKFPDSEFVTIHGMEITADTIPLIGGWNIIGSISNDVSVSSATTSPPGILTTEFFEYHKGYAAADSLHPGGGYWVKTSNPGELILTTEGIANSSSVVHTNNYLNSVTIKDHAGHIQTLFFGRSGDSVDYSGAYEMPPIPPNNSFDVRFKSGKMLELFGTSGTTMLPIKLSNPVYPISIEWLIEQDALDVSLKFDSCSVSMSRSGDLTISTPVTSLILMLFYPTQIPGGYALSQNYPNPFNSQTLITFTVPIQSVVSIDVFNILGEKVQTLYDGSATAGVHRLYFKGAEMPSGVYFYKLITPVQSIIKKMVVIR